MKIGSTAIKSNSQKFNIDLELMQKAGFRSLDYGEFSNPNSFLFKLNETDFEQYLIKLRNECLQHNIIINQLHSIWVMDMYKFDNNKHLLSSTLDLYIKTIKGASILGCKYVVVHHRFPFEWDKVLEHNDHCRKANVKFLKALIPYAEKYNVTICLENLPFIYPYTQFEDTIKQVEEINSEYVGMCFDTGHFNMFNNDYNITNAVKRMGKHFKVMHCHDNNGNGDQHLFPKEGNFDWENFAKALKEIGFKGVFSYETQSSAIDKKTILKEETQLCEFTNKLIDAK